MKFHDIQWTLAFFGMLVLILMAYPFWSDLPSDAPIIFWACTGLDYGNYGNYGSGSPGLWLIISLVWGFWRLPLQKTSNPLGSPGAIGEIQQHYLSNIGYHVDINW